MTRAIKPLEATRDCVSPEALKAMKDGIERLRRLGVEAIDD
jgi:hypothetical protein